MRNNDHLESFLSSVEKNEIPDTATLKSVATSLKAMQAGASFKSAFSIQKKRGPVPFEEKTWGEAEQIFELIREYYSMTEQGIRGEMAKGKICDAHNISERTFDTYRALYRQFCYVKDSQDVVNSRRLS